eukprot:2459363-Heterocapsa_arctica.AAC.1
MTLDFVAREGERSVSAKFAPGGIAGHGSGMDEPPEGLPGAAAVKDFNGGKPFMEEARGREPKRGAVRGDDAAGGGRANGRPDGDVFHASAVPRPQGLHRRCAQAHIRGC